MLLTPIAYTMGVKYGITNEAILGAICIPVGVGNVCTYPFLLSLNVR